jgi:hypothetical protein
MENGKIKSNILGKFRKIAESYKKSGKVKISDF